jgi:heat shock protein HslJ
MLLLGCNKKPEQTQVATPKPAPAEQAPETSALKIDSSSATNKPVTAESPKPNSTEKPASATTETAEPVAPEMRKPKLTESPIKNKRWKLIELEGEKVEVTEDFSGDPYFTLSLHTDKIHGSGGCNRFGGKYSLEGEKLTISRLVATKKRCENVTTIETSFISNLEQTDGYKIAGDALSLQHGGKTIMKFEAVYVN